MRKAPLSWVWNDQFDHWYGPYSADEIDVMFGHLQDLHRKVELQVVVDSKIVRRRVALSEEKNNA